MTEQELRKLEAEVYGRAGAPMPGEAKESALSEGTGDAALAFADKVSFGLLPALASQIEKLTGSPDQLTVADRLERGQARSPVWSTVGGAAGMMVPATGIARAGQLAGIGSKMALGALGGGGANVADQAVRTVTEDRPFSGTEAAANTAIGAVGISPVVAAARGIGGLGRKAGEALSNRILSPAAQRLLGELPEASAAAARTLDDAATIPRPPPPPPPPPPPVPEPQLRMKQNFAGIPEEAPSGDPLDFSRYFDRVPVSGPPGPLAPRPQGVRASEALSSPEGRAMASEALRRNVERTIGGGEATKMPLPEQLEALIASRPPPPAAPPPGLLSLPLSRLGGLELGSSAVEVKGEEKRRRRRDRGGR